MKVKKSNFLICIPHSNLSNICAWVELSARTSQEQGDGQKNREMHRCTESLSLLPENDHKIPPEKFIIFIVEIKLQSKLTVRFIMRTGLAYVINIT